MPPVIPFGEWLPDQPELSNPGALTMTNVLPKTLKSYGPAPAMSAVTGALDARCQGAIYVRDNAAGVWGFAGDQTKLYSQTAGSTDWEDISQLDTTQNITAITQANPGQVTIVGHGYSTGDVLYITGVTGMTEVNGLRVTITVVDVDNFTIGIDTSGFTAYVSGGTVQEVLFYNTSVDERWSFAVFGERVIATNYTDDIQSYVMNTSVAFSDLSANAPKARYIARVKEWIMVANTTDPTDGAVPQRVWWSAIDDPTTWPTPGSTTAIQLQSDYQDLLGEGGWCQGLVGGLSGADVAIFQERNIWRGMYVGPPAIFTFAVVESARGTPAPGSIVSVGPVVFYLADDGFYAFDGVQSVPIGDQKVDRHFLSEVDQSSYYRITSAADPLNKLVWWFYPGPQASGGTPNRALVYHYGIKRWAKIEGQEVEVMVNALTTGYTLDQLDAFGTLETLPFSLDSRAWTGGRLNLAAFNTDHELALFSGAALAATMDTAEAMIFPTGKAQVSRVWPIVDTNDAQIAIGRRDKLADAVSWTAASSMTSTTGSCPVRANARYLRARVTIPAGATWNHAQGIEPEARPAGRR